MIKCANTKDFEEQQECVGVTLKQHDRVAKALALELKKAKASMGEGSESSLPRVTEPV